LTKEVSRHHQGPIRPDAAEGTIKTWSMHKPPGQGQESVRFAQGS
jgi:hypothetical protein